MTIEAMKQALEAWQTSCYGSEIHHKAMLLAMTKIGQAIEQAEKQEPVAWMLWLHGPAGLLEHKQLAELEFERRNKEYPDENRKLVPLYTTPQPNVTTNDTKQECVAKQQKKRHEWVGLTDEEIALVCAECAASAHRSDDISFARAIEAKLKEKNT
jgi:hypothetical protein